MKSRSEAPGAAIAAPPIAATQLHAEPGPAGKEFVLVDDDRLMVSDTTRLTRWWLTVPMALIMLIFPVMYVHGVVTSFVQSSQEWLTYQDNILTNFDETYLRNILDSGMPTTLRYTYDDGHVSFGEYLRHQWVDRPGNWKIEASMLGLSIVFLAMSAIGLGMGFAGRRRQRLVFDRKRQAAYTWLFGMTFAAPWEKLSVAMRPTGVSWLLRHDDTPGNTPRQVPVPVYLGASALSPALDEWKLTHCGRVAAFMADGPAAIEGAPFTRKDPFTLREDPVPPEGMAEVDRLLAKLRSEPAEAA